MMPKKLPGKIKEILVVVMYLIILLLFAHYETNRKASFPESSPAMAGPGLRPSYSSVQADIFRSFVEQSHE